MRSLKFIVVAILTVVLALSSTLNAHAATELKYDDGVETTAYVCPSQNTWRTVRFVFSDFGLSGSWKLLTARFYQSTVETAHDQVELHVLNSDGSADLAGSTPVTFTTITGWNDVDLSGQNIIVSGDFWIAYKWLGQFLAPCLATDTPSLHGRSFSGSPGSWTLDDNYDYWIRAVIGSLGGGAAVGGVLMPANTFALLSPWLAVIGLVGCIGTTVVVAKKREK